MTPKLYSLDPSAYVYHGELTRTTDDEGDESSLDGIVSKLSLDAKQPFAAPSPRLKSSSPAGKHLDKAIAGGSYLPF